MHKVILKCPSTVSKVSVAVLKIESTVTTVWSKNKGGRPLGPPGLQISVSSYRYVLVYSVKVYLRK